MSVESDLFAQLMKLYIHLLAELEHNSATYSHTILDRMNQSANKPSICKVIIRQDSQTSTIIHNHHNYATTIETFPFNYQDQHPQATCYGNHCGNMSYLHDLYSNNSSLPHSESLLNNPHDHQQYQPRSKTKPNSSSQLLSETKLTKQTAHIKPSTKIEFIQISSNSIIENHLNPLKRKRGRPKKESNKKR